MRPAATVFLTFDDGFRDNHETVLPLLREYGFAAFVFVLPPLLEDGGAFEWPEMRDDLRRSPRDHALGHLVDAGGDEGGRLRGRAATRSATPTCRGSAASELREELWESRAAIKERLGSCDTLAYPFGEWSAAVAAAAAECGYRFAFTLPTVTGQRDATPLSIPRVNVDYRDDERRFALKLSRSGRRLLLSAAVGALRRRRRGG